MRFSYSYTEGFNFADCAAELGNEMAIAWAAFNYFEQLERIAELKKAQNEIEENESLTRYASEAASAGLDRLIEETRNRADAMSQQWLNAFDARRESGLQCKTIKAGVTAYTGWSERADRAMTGNCGAIWTRCKEWLANGDDSERVLHPEAFVW